MPAHAQVSIIDPDRNRHAWIVRELAHNGRVARTYDSLKDMVVGASSPGLCIVHDTGDAVPETVAYLRQIGQPAAVLAYSEQPAVRTVVTALRAGAQDYIDGLSSGPELIEAIDGLDRYLSREKRHSAQTAMAHERVSRLTTREREVLNSVVMGRTNREIAQNLGISPRTVEIHRSNMLSKLGATNSPDAVRIALDSGLVN